MCKYCNGKLKLYQKTVNTKIYINTKDKASCLFVESNGCPTFPVTSKYLTSVCSLYNVPNRASFIINYCPNCGRKLKE